MNKLGVILLVAVLAMTTESCNFWRRSVRRHREVVAVDSTSALRNDSVKQIVVVTDTAVIHTDTVSASAVNIEKQQLIESLLPVWKRSIAYNTFSGKAKVHYEGKGDKQDFTANIRIERDKRIWVSITALGLFEAARALITPDSIIVIDRIHHEVRALPFAEAGKLLPVAVDFGTLQRLIIGDILQAGDAPNDATLFGGGFSLHSGNAEYDQQITYNRTDSTIRQQQLKATGEGGSPSLLIQYGDYNENAGRRFSSSRVFNITDKGEQLFIDMQYTNADFDVPLEFSFSIPTRYERK